MRHDPAAGAIVIMLRSLKMYGMAQAVTDLIEQGAPAQVFISADLEWMDYLQQRGRVDAASRHELLGNRLVLVAPQDGLARVDLARAGSIAAALGAGRLAGGQTASVPAGALLGVQLGALFFELVEKLCRVGHVVGAGKNGHGLG